MRWLSIFHVCTACLGLLGSAPLPAMPAPRPLHHSIQCCCPSLTSTPAPQAPTEILAEQHFRSLQRLVQDMTREAGRRGETGFRQPRITLVGGGIAARGCIRGPMDREARTACEGLLDASVERLACQRLHGCGGMWWDCLHGCAPSQHGPSHRSAGDGLSDRQGAAPDQRAAGERGDVRWAGGSVTCCVVCTSLVIRSTTHVSFLPAGLCDRLCLPAL